MNGIFSGLAAVVFPSRCLACGAVVDEDKEVFCSGCFARIKCIRSPLCTCCGEPFAEPGENDHLCGACLSSKPLFSEARALGHYESVLMDLIHKFKYGGKVYIGEKLGELMAAHAYPSFDFMDFSLIMPVPLHPRRLRQRGFNQALVLAREISRRFSIGIDFSTLKRISFTESQTGLSREMRERNIRGAFSIADSGNIAGERIIIVDDVYTTGSTVKECARLLLKNKAEKVAVLTLARA